MASQELRAFYASLNTEDDLWKLIAGRVKEGLYLEFKTKKDSRNPDIDPDSDAFQFSRALSGFANSDGGALIWGIATNANEEAAELKPIFQVKEFEARLRKSLLNSTQPTVDGVLFDTILKVGSAADGYLKCLIPASDKTPHRAMLARREYYKRTAEGFYRLEHFDLEDMFGRRPRPSLRIAVELRSRPEPDPQDEVYFSFLNEGRGIAKHFGFMCTVDTQVQIVDVYGVVNNTWLNQGRPTISFTNDVGVLHPNGIWAALGHAVIRRPDRSAPLTLNMVWYCEGMMKRSAALHVGSGVQMSTDG